MSVESVLNDPSVANPSVELPLQIVRKTYTFAPETRPITTQDFGEDLFDPTGFVPLEVMIEQQRIAGHKADFQRAMFDFDDWKEIYLETEKPDFDDDFAVMEYIREIEDKKNKLFAERQAEFDKDFAEFMQSKRKHATTINDDANSSTGQTQQSESAGTADSQVGSGETSPA